MAINFNDYLKMTGLGESAPITRRRKRNVKPGKFNPVAFAESYSYIIQEGRRMRLSGIANERQARQITARGEAGIEDAKDFIKDKYKQAKDFLIKLWEKVVRFFTETLRYWMSNERKIGKTIAKLKAALKTKKDKISTPLFKIKIGDNKETSNKELVEGNSGNVQSMLQKEIQKLEGELRTNTNLSDEDRGTIQQVISGARERLEKAWLENNASSFAFTSLLGAIAENGIVLRKITTNIPVIVGQQKSVDEANDEAANIIEELKSFSKEFLKNMVDTETISLDASSYKSLVNALITALTGAKDERVMKTLQGEIRDAKKELEKLKKSFKENKEPSEEESLRYQLARISLQTGIKSINILISNNEKILGKLLSYSNKVIAAA